MAGRLALAVWTACALLALAACGGSEDGPADVRPRSADEREILAVVERYEAATREGDAATFCREVLVGGDRPGCEQAVGEAMADPQSDLASEEHVTVIGIEVEVEGDRATARIDDDGERYQTTFVKTDAGWRFQVFD